MKRSPIRAVIISLIVIGISIFNFTQIPGSDCIRAIHIVTLITIGLAAGVMLASILVLIRNRRS